MDCWAVVEFVCRWVADKDRWCCRCVVRPRWGSSSSSSSPDEELVETSWTFKSLVEALSIRTVTVDGSATVDDAALMFNFKRSKVFVRRRATTHLGVRRMTLCSIFPVKFGSLAASGERERGEKKKRRKPSCQTGSWAIKMIETSSFRWRTHAERQENTSEEEREKKKWNRYRPWYSRREGRTLLRLVTDERGERLRKKTLCHFSFLLLQRHRRRSSQVWTLGMFVTRSIALPWATATSRAFLGAFLLCLFSFPLVQLILLPDVCRAGKTNQSVEVLQCSHRRMTAHRRLLFLW